MTQDLMKILSLFVIWMIVQSIVSLGIALFLVLAFGRDEITKPLGDALNMAYLGAMLAGVFFSIIQAGSK